MHLSIPGGVVDLDRARFERADGEIVPLSRREADLLGYLAERTGQDVPRDELLGAVWGHHALSLSRAVDTAVARLRRKIEADPASPEVLCTAHGEGYRLVLEAPEARPVVARRAPRLVLGDRTVDLDAGLVRGVGAPVALTGQERKLLSALAERPGAVVAPERLARVAGVIGGRPALASAVCRLRAKLEVDPSDPHWLVGVRGQGYRLDAQPPSSAPSLTSLRETVWTVADQLGRLLGLEDCVVYARDGAYLVQVAAYGMKAPSRGDIASPLALRVGEGIVGTVARSARPQCVADVRHDPRYVADLAPMRSELAVPIVRGEEVVGVLDSESPRVAAYEERHRSAFEALAAIASAAVGDLSLALAA